MFERSDFMIEDEQGFRPGSGWADQAFALMQLIEKACKGECKVRVGFMDLEKAYDRLDTEG